MTSRKKAGAVVFFSPNDDPVAWRRALEEHLGAGLDFRVWPDAGAAAEVDVAVVWKPPPGMLAGFANLKLIASLGMGVDHIFADPKLPQGVKVARIVDPDLVAQMSEYVLHAVLHRHRMFDVYEGFQRQGKWQQIRPPVTAEKRVGIMGLGEIGADAAGKLAGLGFAVAGWSRSAKSIAGIESFHGADGFAPFLARSDIVVCLLPLTPATEGVLDRRAFAAMPAGGYVINAARGGHVVEEDLLAALDSGQIAGAALDVFATEPLPEDHPFWRHPKVRLTPHVAGLTRPETAARQIAENIRRAHAGQPLLNLVDPEAGY